MLKKRKNLFFLSIFSSAFLLCSPVNCLANKGLKLLEETSKSFTSISKKAIPAAVCIKAEYKSPMLGFSDRSDNPFDSFSDQFFRRFFGQSPFDSPHSRSPREPAKKQVAGGSGFIVTPDGYIITNNHVIKDAIAITAVLDNGKEYEAEVVGTDPRSDLAVLKIAGKDLPYLELGDSDALEIGEWAIAIGSPFALEASLTVGVISAKGRQDLGITTLEDFIQTDAAINPGNSGGPLLNLKGEVIGVNTALATRSGGYMGIGFAIPSNITKHVMDQIIQNGEIHRTYLGVMLQPLDKELIDALSLDKAQEGILIAEVMEDSPAKKGGLEQGDIVVELNKKPVKSVTKFRNEIALMNPGQEADLKVLRKGKTLTLKAILGALNDTHASLQEVGQKLGVEVENLTPELAKKLGFKEALSGVVITNVLPGSPAALAGLRNYQLITAVLLNWDQQKAVHNAQEFQEAMKEAVNRKYVVLLVRHQNGTRYHTVKLK